MATQDEMIKKPKIKIKVFGVGGGGNKVLLRMHEHADPDIGLVGINTDAAALKELRDVGIETIQIGEQLTHGLGTGNKPAIGEQAANAAKSAIADALNGVDLVFITAAMGGGTGTGAAPIVAELAHQAGVLSVGVTTIPFKFEGTRKRKVALTGISYMKQQMDAFIAVENDNLLKLPGNQRLSMVETLKVADGVLMQAIRGLTGLILTTGVINVDFADITTIFRQSEESDALLGIGHSDRSALEAVKEAARSQLTDRQINGARGVILNITTDDSLTMEDVGEVSEYITQVTSEEVNIIFGVVIDDDMKGSADATIIATDFESDAGVGAAAPRPVVRPATARVQRPAAPVQPQPAKPQVRSAAQPAQSAPAAQPAPAPAAAAPASGGARTFTVEMPSFMNHSHEAGTGHDAAADRHSTPAARPAFRIIPDMSERKDKDQ